MVNAIETMSNKGVKAKQDTILQCFTGIVM